VELRWRLLCPWHNGREPVQDSQKLLDQKNWTRRLEEHQKHRATADSNSWVEVRIV
jgi:hypothetical protein